MDQLPPNVALESLVGNIQRLHSLDSLDSDEIVEYSEQEGTYMYNGT